MGNISVAIKKRSRAGFGRIIIADLTYSNSYATGGDVLTVVACGLENSIDLVLAQPKSGLNFEYDAANLKLKAFAPLRKFTATLDPASLATVTARDDAITMTGVLAADEVVGGRGPDALESKLVPKGYRASGTDTVTVRQDNPSAASIDAASGTWTAFVAGANMAGKEIASTTDLSAIVCRAIIFGDNPNA